MIGAKLEIGKGSIQTISKKKIKIQRPYVKIMLKILNQE